MVLRALGGGGGDIPPVSRGVNLSARREKNWLSRGRPSDFLKKLWEKRTKITSIFVSLGWLGTPNTMQADRQLFTNLPRRMRQQDQRTLL